MSHGRVRRESEEKLVNRPAQRAWRSKETSPSSVILIEALSRARSFAPLRTEVLREMKPDARSHLSVNERGRIHLIPIPDILFLKAELKYVTVRTAERTWPDASVGGVHIVYDQPSSVLGSLGSAQVDGIAIDLDDRISRVAEESCR